MPRKAKAKKTAVMTRRITINVTIEGDVDEDMIPLMIAEFPDVFDEIRGKNKRRQCLAISAVVHDGQDPIAEYQYCLSAEGADSDVREVRVADEQYLAGLGYKV